MKDKVEATPDLDTELSFRGKIGDGGVRGGVESCRSSGNAAKRGANGNGAKFIEIVGVFVEREKVLGRQGGCERGGWNGCVGDEIDEALKGGEIGAVCRALTGV